MIRRTRPDEAEAAKLALLDQLAYGRTTSPWKPDDYVEMGARENVAILADPVLEQGMIMVQCAGHEAEILTLAVVPDKRRQGLGRALLEGAHAFARGQAVREIFLEVADDNLGALRLYSGSGYAPIALRRGYYERGRNTRVDGVVMRKNI